MKVLLFLFILLQLTFSQVNTEVFRADLDSSIWKSQIDLSLNIAKGNSDFESYKIDSYTAYRNEENIIFLVGKYKRAIQGQSLFVHKGFFHLRDSYKINYWLDAEAMFQLEFNDFIDLKSRTLFGAYARFKLKEEKKIQLVTALGLMTEKEISKNSALNSDLLRSTNYLSFKWTLDERIRFSMVLYYQAALRSFSDYRILNDAAFYFSLSKYLSFKTELNYRYDSQAIQNVKAEDLEILFGLSIEF